MASMFRRVWTGSCTSPASTVVLIGADSRWPPRGTAVLPMKCASRSCFNLRKSRRPEAGAPRQSEAGRHALLHQGRRPHRVSAGRTVSEAAFRHPLGGGHEHPAAGLECSCRHRSGCICDGCARAPASSHWHADDRWLDGDPGGTALFLRPPWTTTCAPSTARQAKSCGKGTCRSAPKGHRSATSRRKPANSSFWCLSAVVATPRIGGDYIGAFKLKK